MTPQAVLSEGPVKVSAGNLCFSDLASLIRECGVRLECNRISKFQGNVMTR